MGLRVGLLASIRIFSHITESNQPRLVSLLLSPSVFGLL